MSARPSHLQSGDVVRADDELWREVESLGPAADLSEPVRRGVLWEANPHHFRLRLPGVARCRVDHGGPVLIEREQSSCEDDLRWLIQGLPLAAVWVQRQALVMRGAALSSERGAVVILGHPGAGSSSIAAALALRGLTIACDAVTPLAVTGSGLRILPGLADVMLDEAAIEALGIPGAQTVPVRPGLARRFIRGLARSDNAGSVRNVYLLRTHNHPTLEFKELRGQDKLLRPLAYAFNRRLPELPQAPAMNFVRYGASMAALRVIEVTRCEGAQTIADLADRILRDLA